MKIFINEAFRTGYLKFAEILNELERILEFIVPQLKEIRFTGKYCESDRVFEKELIKLIDRFSEISLDALRLAQNFQQLEETKRLFEIIEILLQSSLIVRHSSYDKNTNFAGKVVFYKYVLKTKTNLKFQVDFFAPRFFKDVKGSKLVCKCIVVNEKAVEKYQKNPDEFNLDDCCGTLTHTTQSFSDEDDHHTLTAQFSNLTVLNINRSERKNTDIVTDEKVVFVFHVYFQFQNRNIDVSSCSSYISRHFYITFNLLFHRSWDILFRL